ncbi:MAG: hypothetical protein J6P84_00525 [Alphaproteobacteria bacterium]|nr:hypothetical protein [Alphaproteobacteria bacterium]MBO7642248.1 hypothetical protein [Alphaproteobacteria bacterium]
MTKILLIVSIMCFEIGAFGMPYDEANGSEHYRKNFYLIKKNVRRHQRWHLPKQRTVNNNWINSVETLESLGALNTNSPTEPMFPRLSKEENEQPYQKNLQTYPEWDEYINWDPEEPSTSCPKEISQPVSERNPADKSVQEIISKDIPPTVNDFFCGLSNNQTALPQRRRRSSIQSRVNFCQSRNQSGEEKSRFRLKKVQKQVVSFTRKSYMEITCVSSTTSSRDFEYGLDHGILSVFRVHNENVYTFISKIP